MLGGAGDKQVFWPLRGVSFSVDTSKSFRWYPGAWSREPCCALPAEDMVTLRGTLPAVSLFPDASCFSALTPQKGQRVQMGCFQQWLVWEGVVRSPYLTTETRHL